MLTMVKKKIWSYRVGKGGSIWRKFSLHCFFFFFCLENKRLHLYKPMLCWQLQNCGINCLYSVVSWVLGYHTVCPHSLLLTVTSNWYKNKIKKTFKSRNDTQREIGWNEDASGCLVETELQNLCILCHNIEICCCCKMDFTHCPLKSHFIGTFSIICFRSTV